MFNGLWAAFDEAEVPIGSITNGVHAPSWVAREIFDLAGTHGADVRSGDLTESSRFAVTSAQVAAVMRYVRAATECGWGSRNGCPSCLQELAERMVNGRTFALGCHRCSVRVGPTGARRACRRLDGLSDRGGVSMGDRSA